MKELVCEEREYLEEYDVNVEQFLTYAQIQAMANKVVQLDTWAERERSIDELLIHFCTDITDEEVKELDYDIAVKSGLIRDIRWNVLNLDDVYNAIKYEESITKQLKQLLESLKKMPEFSQKMEEVKSIASKK